MDIDVLNLLGKDDPRINGVKEKRFKMHIDFEGKIRENTHIKGIITS